MRLVHATSTDDPAGPDELLGAPWSRPLAGALDRLVVESDLLADNPLGDPVRRRILELLVEDELTSGAITTIVRDEFGISQPAVSQHLRVLKEAELVTDRPEGTRRLYSVRRTGLEALRAELESMWDETLAAFAAAADVDPPGEPTLGGPTLGRRERRSDR